MHRTLKHALVYCMESACLHFYFSFATLLARCVLCLVARSCLTFVTPWTVAHQAPLSMGILQARILEWIAMPSSRGPSQHRDWTYVYCIVGGFFTIWAIRNPKNIGVGRLSLLQGIFPTQKLNQGLLNCRQILYQLSYQGNPLARWPWVLFNLFKPQFLLL